VQDTCQIVLIAFAHTCFAQRTRCSNGRQKVPSMLLKVSYQLLKHFVDCACLLQLHCLRDATHFFDTHSTVEQVFMNVYSRFSV